ncbi:hypothetical protein [Caballeronia sp. KNU42]
MKPVLMRPEFPLDFRLLPQPHAIGAQRRGDFLFKSMHRRGRAKKSSVLFQTMKGDPLLPARRTTLVNRDRE